MSMPEVFEPCIPDVMQNRADLRTFAGTEAVTADRACLNHDRYGQTHFEDKREL